MECSKINCFEIKDSLFLHIQIPHPLPQEGTPERILADKISLAAEEYQRAKLAPSKGE